MIELLCFELKKIMKKKLNIIVILGSLVLTTILFALPVMQYMTLDKDGNQLKDFSAIELEKKFYKEISGTLTDERIKIDILKYQDLFKDPENIVIDGKKKKLKDTVYNANVGPYTSYLKLINTNYVDANIEDYSFDKIENMQFKNGLDFYKTRTEKVSSLLNSSYEDWNYSKQEKKFWIEKNGKIETPYIYGYHQGWNMIFNSSELLMLPIISICICIASVFSGEYQSGADSIILSSLYGKSKLIRSKILASFIFAFLIFTINIILSIGILLISFGVDGWNLPIQIINSTIPYHLTFLTGSIVCIVTLYLILSGMVAITLLLSSKMKTPFPVLVVVILIVIVPLFLNFSLTNGVWNHIFMLLPYIASQSVFGIDATNYFSYPFPGFTLDVVTMRMVVYIIISIICVPFAYLNFKNHQVM